MQRADPDIVSVVYSGDTDATKDEILAKVKVRIFYLWDTRFVAYEASRFDISLDPGSVHFVFLKSRYLVEDSTWPRFTLLGQSLGSMYLAWEAMSMLIPDLYIGRVPVGAYVHYPTISTDMLARVKSRKRWHTNADGISSSAVLSQTKLLYYRFFMFYYSMSLRTANFIMVNSSWTKNHVDSILQYSDTLLDLLHLLPPLFAVKLLTPQNAPKSARIVYPPCDTREMAKFPLTPRERVILSVAQFRPEKDHQAQLHAFNELLISHPEYSREGADHVKLVLVGGSRNEGDAHRVRELETLARDLGIEAHVEFVVNASYPVVLDWLSKASIGLSTMVDEHFGINIVEFMAAGVIPVAHASGGPLKDIIVPFNGERTGFHALTTKEFAEAFQTILTLSPDEEASMRWRARAWAVQRFSEEEFERGWNQSGWRNYLPSQ
ncbi:hypothetical protein CVT26_009431 [Gymnopilus dilepis]|uniref:GDP-Man:Man(3)GlcNAc(2)-PP-Dol alpha-1,2-mannosyltransferase n=1 Tax=Gymnopilus dilepis TaxID=231916 RepID=A0A409YIC3_9AGAR|nr:hypothetical protein CVT26_009431 [Gymnopilus dilepis]